MEEEREGDLGTGRLLILELGQCTLLYKCETFKLKLKVEVSGCSGRRVGICLVSPKCPAVTCGDSRLLGSRVWKAALSSAI